MDETLLEKIEKARRRAILESEGCSSCIDDVNTFFEAIKKIIFDQTTMDKSTFKDILSQDDGIFFLFKRFDLLPGIEDMKKEEFEVEFSIPLFCLQEEFR